MPWSSVKLVLWLLVGNGVTECAVRPSSHQGAGFWLWTFPGMLIALVNMRFY